MPSNPFVPSLLGPSTPATNTSPNLVLPSHDLSRSYTSTVRLLGTHPRLQLTHESPGVTWFLWLGLRGHSSSPAGSGCGETEGSDEAARRSTPSDVLRTQEEPCWEPQAWTQGWEVGGEPGTEWTALEARALSRPTSGCSLAGSAHKTVVNFYNSPRKDWKAQRIQ